MSAFYSLLLLLALISHESFWNKVHFDKRIDSFVFTRTHGCILNDIEGVRIPCLCILYSNATKIQISA
jgi:hypothetical protein